MRKQVFKFSKLISFKFGFKYVLIKMSKDIQFIKLEDLYEKCENEKGSLVSRIKPELISKVGLEFPSPSIEIIDLYNSDRPGIWQIFAQDTDSNILIIATWDLDQDRELSMYQFRCDSDRPQDLFLQSSK